MTVRHSDRPTILLVEDSDIDAELIGIHLQRAGLDHEMRRARNRAEFMRELQAAAQHERHIDLMLADYSLPDIDGIAALEIAKVKLPALPVVFVSGVGGEELATNALHRGATDYVLKRNLTRLAGAVTRALAETRERAQRHKVELALIKSEANMRLALDAANLGLWNYRDDDSIGCDGRCAAMLGIGPVERLPYADFLALVHGADRESLEQGLGAAMADENSPAITDEFRIAAPDGTVRWIVLRGRRLAVEGGTLRMSGVMQDVTATRLLESRQRQTELLFKLAAQATGLGVWDVGHSADEVWVDAGYRAIAGLDASEDTVLSTLMDKVVHPDDRAALSHALACAVQDGADDLNLEHRLIRPIDGQLRWIAVQGRRIIGVDGLPRLVGTARDITEQRRLQVLLEKSNEELEHRVAERTRELTAEIAERNRVEDTLQQMQRLEAVGQLTSGVAHDFNNLLTVVVSNIALISRLLQQQPAAPDERVIKRLASMRDAANRGATLTKQLLAFSRRQRLEPQTISFNEIVLGMRDLLQTTLGGSVHLETELADNAWLALVDPTQMELIILNLAINARDAMEVGGNLQVRTANIVVTTAPARPEEPEPGEYVVLSVSDTGSGMSDAVLAKAFEPFFTTKEVGKGSGLGLAQVFGFAKQSGGGVRIETEVGRGTTVQVFMPRSREVLIPATEAAVGAVLEPDATAQRHTVLLVDDDPAVREATASLLEVLGYEVAQKSDAATALEYLHHAEGIDLVIADFAMPRMNGVEMAALIRKQHPQLPVMFLTGYADLSVPQDVPNSFLLQKPVQEAELAARLREALSVGRLNSTRR